MQNNKTKLSAAVKRLIALSLATAVGFGNSHLHSLAQGNGEVFSTVKALHRAKKSLSATKILRLMKALANNKATRGRYKERIVSIFFLLFIPRAILGITLSKLLQTSALVFC